MAQGHAHTLHVELDMSRYEGVGYDLSRSTCRRTPCATRLRADPLPRAGQRSPCCACPSSSWWWTTPSSTSPCRPSCGSCTPRRHPAMGGRRLHPRHRRAPAHPREPRRPHRAPPHAGRRPRWSSGSDPLWRPGCSGSAAQLIACRVLMGIGAAAIMPATLSILTNVFTDATERAKAIALWSAVAGLGVADRPDARRVAARALQLGLDLHGEPAHRGGRPARRPARRAALGQRPPRRPRPDRCCDVDRRARLPSSTPSSKRPRTDG